MGRSANPWTGVIDSPDGKRYAGEFYENERSGFGVFVNQNSKDLKSFKGFYKNDLPNGLGEAEYVDGSIYKVGFLRIVHVAERIFSKAEISVAYSKWENYPFENFPVEEPQLRELSLNQFLNSNVVNTIF